MRTLAFSNARRMLGYRPKIRPERRLEEMVRSSADAG
jgi:hypothetical protein